MGKIRNAIAALRGAPIAAPRSKRTFAAGAYGRLNKSFTGSQLHINESILRSLKTMRARSRQLAHDNEYMKRFLQLVKTNVVGPMGVRYQSRATRIDGTPDEIDRATIERAMAVFSKAGNFEVTGKLSRPSAERLFIEQCARDGEILIRMRPGYARSESRFALQLLDPDLLDEELNVDGPRKIRMGVEIDDDERPVAYHILKVHPGEGRHPGSITGVGFADTHWRVPAEEIIHWFLPMRAGQIRGIPWGHAAIICLHDLGEYRKSAMVAARIGADKVGFFAGDQLYDDDELNEDGEYFEMPSAAGEFGRLPPGTELHEWDPNYPHEQFEKFNKAMIRGLAGGFGVAYNGFANDLEGVNFSSIRAGVLDERDAWMVIQNEFISGFHGRWHDIWMSLQQMAGNLGTIPAGALSSKLPHHWQGRRWQWVDPSKDVNANKEAWLLGVKSQSQIIRELGQDPEEVWQEIAQDKQRMEALGISVVASAPPAPVPPDDGGNNDEIDDD